MNNTESASFLKRNLSIYWDIFHYVCIKALLVQKDFGFREFQIGVVMEHGSNALSTILFGP